jgi:hypothetical protein
VAALLLQLSTFYPDLHLDTVAGDAGFGLDLILSTDADKTTWLLRGYDDRGRPICPFGYAFSTLIRWAGLTGIGSGLLVGLGFILHPPNEAAAVSTSLWSIAQALLVLSLLCGIPALFGLYARQSEATKLLGLIGFVLIFLFSIPIAHKCVPLLL